MKLTQFKANITGAGKYLPKKVVTNHDLEELVKTSDVLIHNHPVQRANALGLAYSRLKKINPRLIYLAITGFGSSGKYTCK